MTQAYPLQWPAHRPRTPLHKREHSRFDVTTDTARREMVRECKAMKGTHIVISTNVELRLDGLPYASRRAPEDTAVALYFQRNGEAVCFSCDRYLAVWENMRAIGKTIEAMRGIERWGAHEVLDQMFTGFTALPPPDAMTTPPPMQKLWFEVLGVAHDSPLVVANAAYKALVRNASEQELYVLNDAIAHARKHLKGTHNE